YGREWDDTASAAAGHACRVLQRHGDRHLGSTNAPHQREPGRAIVISTGMEAYLPWLFDAESFGRIGICGSDSPSLLGCRLCANACRDGGELGTSVYGKHIAFVC